MFLVVGWPPITAVLSIKVNGLATAVCRSRFGCDDAIHNLVVCTFSQQECQERFRVCLIHSIEIRAHREEAVCS